MLIPFFNGAKSRMHYTINTLDIHAFNNYLLNKSSAQYSYKTNAGWLTMYATELGIYKAIFNDISNEKELPLIDKSELQKLLLVGTEFQIQVWKTLLTIPHGTKVSYTAIAHMIGKPNACRAVARAIATNNIAYFIPCHRIIRISGDLGGYRWGKERKNLLLADEQK